MNEINEIKRKEIWDYIHDNYKITINSNANINSESAGEPYAVIMVKRNSVIYQEAINVRPLIEALVRRIIQRERNDNK